MRSPGTKPSSPEFPLTELPSGARPFGRRPVRGRDVDVLVEHLAPNIWSRHRHGTWQITIPFSPAVCDVTWWTPRGRKVQRRIGAGEVWILPPGWHHAVRWREQADVIVLFLAPEAVTAAAPTLQVEARVASLDQCASVAKIVVDLCLELRRFAPHPNGPGDWHVAGAGTLLAVVLLEAQVGRLRHSYQPSAGLPGRILAEVGRYLDERKNQRVAVAGMARALRISTRHLRRLFRRLTGKSPQEWVIGEKANRARTLLLAGHSPKETAAATGFSDTRHLRRVCRMCFGVAPSAFVPKAATGPSRA
jgi:AraC-like DNA-binding protein